MIIVENGIQLGTSTQRIMRYCRKKNYNIAIRTRRSDDPSSSEIIPRQYSSTGRSNERLSSSHSACRQRSLVVTEPGSIGSWDKSYTLKLKSWLMQDQMLSIDHLIRTNDLELKTVEGVRAVGVLITASHTTKSGLDPVCQFSLLVIPPSSWSDLQAEIIQYAKFQDLRICIADPSRNNFKLIKV